MIRNSFLLGVILLSSCFLSLSGPLPKLIVSANGHYLVDENGKPFFWLGDTGWLLFTKLTREEAILYLEDRAAKGFNVIQVMVLHDVTRAFNAYGDSAIASNDVTRPLLTPGSDFEDKEAYDFWDHVDYVIRHAESRGIYMALVPVWGSNVKSGKVNTEQATHYGKWLAERYRNFSNIIWLNGGDIVGADAPSVWKALGNALNENDPNHLITFHPFGRTSSAWWFHDQPWLDFNMVQSGHRRYDQDDSERAYGEDNWKYIREGYQMSPAKPILDGEPSYEGIPQGLHDPSQPYWTDTDVRRYAYWSLFSGAFGFTYGHNAVMQFHKPGDSPAYGAKIFWDEAILSPGSAQLKYLKELVPSEVILNRIPNQALLVENKGEKYGYLLATSAAYHAWVYAYSGNPIKVKGGHLKGKRIRATWFDPRTGERSSIGAFRNKGILMFTPPQSGQDWVLELRVQD